MASKRKLVPKGVPLRPPPHKSMRTHETTCGICHEESKITLLDLGCECVNHVCMECFYDYKENLLVRVSYPFFDVLVANMKKEIECPLCRKPVNLDDIGIHFPSELSKCPICKELVDDLEEHIRDHWFEIKCPNCGELCEDANDYKLHMNNECEHIRCMQCKREGNYTEMLIHSPVVSHANGLTDMHCTMPSRSHIVVSRTINTMYHADYLFEHSRLLFQMFAAAVQLNMPNTMMAKSLSELILYVVFHFLEFLGINTFEGSLHEAMEAMDEEEWRAWASETIDTLMNAMHPSCPSPSYLHEITKCLCMLITNEGWISESLSNIYRRCFESKKVRRNRQVERLAMRIVTLIRKIEKKNTLQVPSTIPPSREFVEFFALTRH